MPRTGHRFACVEDADESGNIIEGTDRYAQSVSSPMQERPNTGKALKKDKLRRGSSSRDLADLKLHDSDDSDDDSTAHLSPVRRGSTRLKSTKNKGKEREKVRGSKAVVMRPLPSRQLTSSSGFAPSREDSAYYGIDNHLITPAPGPRPQAQIRPMSYYGPASYNQGDSRPPVSNSRFYAQQQPVAALGTSYPPQHQWYRVGSVPYQMPPPPVISHYLHQYPGPGYPAARPLDQRFAFPRPHSSVGHHAAYSIDYYEPYPPEPINISRARRSSQKYDMPPPALPVRPKSTKLVSTRLPHTPGTKSRKSLVQDEDDYQLFNVSPHVNDSPAPGPERPKSSSARRKSFRNSSFDAGTLRTESARARRGGCMHTTGLRSTSTESCYEDKLNKATTYQEGANGTPSLPLTAESLRRAGKTSSRSTRSTASLEESEYRQSGSTGLTRSSANEEDVTIRVKGSTTLKVGGAEMQCQGAEINIVSSRGQHMEASRAGGSEKSICQDQEDRRTRYDPVPDDIRTRYDHIPDDRRTRYNSARSAARKLASSFHSPGVPILYPREHNHFAPQYAPYGGYEYNNINPFAPLPREGGAWL